MIRLLVLPQVFYHLGELDEALSYALGAGKLFDINEPSEYVQTTLGEHPRCPGATATYESCPFQGTSIHALLKLTVYFAVYRSVHRPVRGAQKSASWGRQGRAHR